MEAGPYQRLQLCTSICKPAPSRAHRIAAYGSSRVFSRSDVPAASDRSARAHSSSRERLAIRGLSRDDVDLPGDHGLDRALPGDRVGRGLQPGSGSEAPRLVCALRDPTAFAASWRPPQEELVPPNKFQPPRPDELDTRGKLLSPTALDWFWPFAREEPDGHPPVYALVGLAGDLLPPSWEPLRRARLGPMIVYSLTCGAIFVFFRGRYGAWPAFAAAGAWMFQPHLFALAHYATYDGLLTSLWVGSSLAFAKAVERNEDSPPGKPLWRWVIVFAALVACAMGTKVTGWLLPLPFLCWVVLYRSRAGAQTLGLALLLALVILLIMIPPWWQNPIHGLDRFFQSNFTRARLRH